MPRHLTYEILGTRIRVLQEKQARLKNRMRLAEIGKIVQLMRDYTITPEALTVEYRARRLPEMRPVSEREITIPRRHVAPKYLHPETGESWSGRGKPARWLVEAELSGARREQFLVARTALAPNAG